MLIPAAPSLLAALFAAEFEQACQQRQLPLSVLPPRSPKLNGHVERAHCTHTEEFYEVTPESWNLLALNRQLQDWERIYNTVRPHQSLDYRTPLEFIEHWKSQRKELQCHKSTGRVQTVDRMRLTR